MTTQRDLPLVWASGGGQTPTGDDKYVSGWVAEIPSFQNFNYVLANTTKNILVSAEQGMYNWEPTITYSPGVRVFDNNKAWTCISENTGEQPSLDGTNSYWVLGYQTGDAPLSSLMSSHGVRIKKVNSRNRNLWDGNDITLDNANSTIMFKTDSVGDDNLVFGNVAGELVVANVGTTVSPDSRNISSSDTGHKIYHEGFKPTQSDVEGTIPDAPDDGPIYGRSNSNWVKVTSTTVSTSPPPPVAGSGQGWYNLDDGTTYVDVDDGDSSQWVPASPPTLPVSYAKDVNYDDADTGLGNTVQEALDNVNGVGPNIITNSNFQVRSRGNSFTTNGYSLDQWVYTGGAGNILSGEIPKPTAPFSYVSCFRKPSTTFIIAQRKPVSGTGLSIYEYSGKTYTASMYISSQITSQISVPWGIYLQHTGGKTLLLVGTYAVNGTTATATFTMPDLSGYTIDSNSYIEFRMLNISTGVVVAGDLTFECSNFKIEHGSIFTGYEPTPYAVDEAECMKWFYSPKQAVYAFPAYNSTTDLSRIAQITFPAPMYLIPHTFTANTGAGFAGGVVENNIGTYGYQIRGTATGVHQGTFLTSITASCEL